MLYWHTVDNNNTDKWKSILKLYDVSLLTNNSSSVALNRIWAFSKVYGNLLAIKEVEKLDIKANHFYFILLAELNKQIDSNRSLEYLTSAVNLCKTDTEKEMINKRIREINQKPT